MPEPVFICGLSRSGTTWIAKSLGQSPELTYIQEAWMVGRLAGLSDWFTMLHDSWADFTPWQRAGIDRRAFVESLAGWYRELLTRAAADRRFVEKTPEENALHLRFLHELFPDAYYVLLQRDGRNYVASLEAMKARQHEPFDFDGACRRWAATTDLFAEVRSARLIRRVAIVRYEDLLDGFAQRFADLCKFAEICPFQPRPYAPNSSFAVAQAPDDFMSRWHVWPEEKRLAFKRHAGRQLVGAGYVTSDDAW